MSVEEIKLFVRVDASRLRKSNGIHGLSHILIDKYEGQVPQSFEALEALPAVGQNV
jgi:endonuclease-3